MTDDTHHGGSQNGGALGARVDNLERSVADIVSSVAEIRNLVLASQKTPWSTLISAAGVIVVVTTGFSQLSLQPVYQATSRNQADIIAINASVVSRGELQGHWDIDAASITGLQKQIDQQREDFGSTYSLRDALGDLKGRLEKLEDHSTHGDQK